MDGADERNISIQKKRAEAAEEAVDSAREALERAEERQEKRRERAARLGLDRPAEPSSAAAAGEAASSRVVPDYAEVSASNEQWAADRGVGELTLDDVLTPEELDELEAFDVKGRERWAMADFVTVGACAAIGLVATAFDDQIDASTKSALGGLGNTSLLRAAEKRGTGLPIDYTGPHFGGPGHRMRSAGHDIGRPWEALKQIMDGEFRGIRWEHGVRETVVRHAGPRGNLYVPTNLPEALVGWMCHLGADVVTPMSLPLPWWSKLYECGDRPMRVLAANLYDQGGGAVSVNARSMFISKSLPVISNEVIIRVKVHIDRYSVSGQFGRLSANTRLRRDEMLLAAQAALGAAALGKTAIEFGATGNPLAARHVNVPALARTGALGLKVTLEHRRRLKAREVPSWDELLLTGMEPWKLPEVQAL